MNTIHYQVSAINPSAHLFEVVLHIPFASEQGHRLSLPNWIPGSYMIRDFAKNVVHLAAESAGQPVIFNKLDKSTWQFAPTSAPLVISYQVYAWDLSVRAAHLDQTHGYFNGTSLFLRVHGFDNDLHELDLKRPEGEHFKSWRVATSLPEKTAKRYGFGSYQAKNYDELIDHPVEMADFSLATFSACGVPHDVVLVGRHYTDMDRLCADLKQICEHHIQFFGEPAPMKRYVFMTYVLGSGYGGLEHRASTSLHCAREDLPLEKDRGKPVTAGYQKYLGLCSHEYFHTWNVKRIKPATFLPYLLEQESYTELLWAFEGITSYFDDLALIQTGLIDQAAYLDTLAITITQVWRSKGRFKQTVTESSFDAWTKFYKQDENAPNAIISYYTKGSLIALALDLKIRLETAGKKSLQDVMRILWRDYGQPSVGVPEQGLHPIVNEVAGTDLSDFLNAMLYSTDDIPLQSLLAEVGINLRFRPRYGMTDRGGVIKEQGNGHWIDLGANFKAHPAGIELTVVFASGAAEKCGLSAGDVVIAVDGLRVNHGNFEQRLQNFHINDSISVHAFRRDELMTFTLNCIDAEQNTAMLMPADGGISEIGKQWLIAKNKH